MIRTKTVKMSAEKYEALSELLQGKRERALTLEGLIQVFTEACKTNKYIAYDILTSPNDLELRYKKNIRK